MGAIGGRKVDLLYRDLATVEAAIRASAAGDVRMDYQPGHPHGWSSAHWMGEVALYRPLHDPTGAVGALKALTEPYPEPLRAALCRLFGWEAGFSVQVARIALGRDDQTQVAGCAHRALSCVTQVLHAVNRRYLVNEKGALDEAAGFPLTLSDLQGQTRAVWTRIGDAELVLAVGVLEVLVRDLEALMAADR